MERVELEIKKKNKKRQPECGESRNKDGYQERILGMGEMARQQLKKHRRSTSSSFASPIPKKRETRIMSKRKRMKLLGEWLAPKEPS